MIYVVIDTNVFGVIAMIKSMFPIMKKQGYGQIININSQSGVMCEPPFPIYNASKTGSNAFRKAVQNDLAQNNIKITDVCPGLIQTDFYKRANNELPSNILIIYSNFHNFDNLHLLEIVVHILAYHHLI